MSRFFSGFVLGAIGGAALAYMIMHEGSWQTDAGDLYARGKRFVETARSNLDEAVQEGQSSADQIRNDLLANTKEGTPRE